MFLSFVTFRVSRFHISHLTHETFKLHLQNTLNMSKTTRVYFGVLHSQLVVKQIEDDYEAKGEKMIRYLKKVRELLKKFLWVQVRHIPRTENSQVDALAKLAMAL